MKDKKAHIFIGGRVQGVSYRYYTLKQASKRGLHGWVKNLPDGRVEAIFEGPERQVKEMVKWCQQGSPAARVENVEVDWSAASNEWADFQVRY